MKLHIIFSIFISLLLTATAFAAEPDTLSIFDAEDVGVGTLPENCTHILPKGHLVYTDYSVERSIDGNYLRARSVSAGSYLEFDLGEIDVEEYSILRWQWKADAFPEIEWEKQPANDDFTLRVELVYDFKGTPRNPLNLIRKGLVTALIKWYPPEKIVSYVWAVNVPIGEAYDSPNEKRTVVIPIESSEYIVNRWMTEEIDVRSDIESAYPESKLYLKKIRVRADTDHTGSIAESGLKYISLIRR